MSAETDKQFEIQKIYLKDVSFESPVSPKVFTEKWNPQTDIHIQSKTSKLDEHLFEVSITVQVTATQDESTAFLVEVTQAGIFLIKNFEQDQHNQLLGSHCPNTLFPFARESIAELIAKGAFHMLLNR